MPAPVHPHQDVPGHVVGLVALVEGGLDGDHVAAAVVGPQRLALAAPVVLDDRVCRVQDVLGGAVVLLQADGPGLGVLLLEVQDVLDVGPPEPVDGLVVVTHHAEVLVPPRQEAGQQILQVVGVLIFVHQHVAELVLVVVQHLRLPLEQRHRVVDDVVKVQCVGGAELLLIGFVDFGVVLHPPVVGRLRPLGEVLDGLVLVLGVADGRQDAPGRIRLFVQVLLLQHVLDDPLGVVGVVDGEVLVKAQPVDVPPQDPHAGGVEGGGPDVVGVRPQPGGQPVFQFPRRLVGEGDGDDLPGPGHVHGAEAPGPADVLLRGPGGESLQKPQVLLRGPVGHLLRVAAPAVGQKVIDPLDQHRGLAAAGTCQQEEWALRGHGGLTLHGVQPLKVLGDDRPPGGDVALLEVFHMFPVLHPSKKSRPLFYGKIPRRSRRENAPARWINRAGAF